MTQLDLAALLNQYVPGLWLFVAIVLFHSVLSTAAYIKKKEFNFALWPKYMMNFIFYIIFIAIANAIIEMARISLNNDVLSIVLSGFQALVYGQTFAYYLDNILWSASELGIPVSPELASVVKGLSGSIKGLIGGNK